ncbi:MAG: PAS domain-containing protein, partial [Haloarculaceae archaeon]
MTDAPSSRRDGAPGSGGGTTDGRRVLSAVAVAFALVAVLFAVATVLAGRVDARPGPGTGVALFGLLGLAAQGDAGDAIERLVEKVEQFERGEDVAFETDRDDEVGRLYEAVGDFAATVRERERDVAATERYRRKLYEVTSATDLSDERKVDRLLELGTERLGVECGLVTNVDEATGRYEIERVTGTDFVEAGTVTDLSTTFCRKTITSDDVLGLSNAPEEHADDPGYREWGLGCYLGGKIEVEGDLYGTLCFVDPEPREREFTDAEKAFVDLMARWVSHVYERREREGERRVAERALEAAPIGIAIAETGDGDDPLVRVNRAFEEITGYPAEEALGRDCRFLQGENTDDAAVAELAAAVDRDEPVTTTLRNYRKDGTLVDVSVSAAPLYDEDGTVAGVAGVLEDISERKASERELEETKDRLDLAIEGARLGVWDWNVETDEVTFNEQWAEMLGYDLDDLGSNLQTWRDLVHPDDLPRAEAALEAHFAGETEYYECEHRLETKSGDWKWIRDVGKVVERDAEGDPVRAVGVHQDVSERKARERELRERERELSTLIDNVPGMVYRCRNEPDWPFEFVSDGCRDVTGYEPEELVSGAVDWNEEVIAEREDELWTAVQRAVDAGESFQVTYPIRTADGERRWVWEQGQGVFRDDGTLDVLEGVIMDVTDRVERERELERT